MQNSNSTIRAQNFKYKVQIFYIWLYAKFKKKTFDWLAFYQQQIHNKEEKRKIWIGISNIRRWNELRYILIRSRAHTGHSHINIVITSITSITISTACDNYAYIYAESSFRLKTKEKLYPAFVFAKNA